MGDSYFRRESGNPNQSSLCTSPSSHGSVDAGIEGSSLVSSGSESSLGYDSENMVYWSRHDGRLYRRDEREKKGHIHDDRECLNRNRRRKSSGASGGPAVKEELSFQSRSSGYVSGSKKGSLSIEMKERIGEEFYERTFSKAPQYDSLCRHLIDVAGKWCKKAGKKGYQIVCSDSRLDLKEMNQEYLDIFINGEDLKMEVLYF